MFTLGLGFNVLSSGLAFKVLSSGLAFNMLSSGLAFNVSWAKVITFKLKVFEGFQQQLPSTLKVFEGFQQQLPSTLKDFQRIVEGVNYRRNEASKTIGRPPLQ